MNPKTRTTTSQLRAICELHEIPFKSSERITTGFGHEVHKVNDDLILKIFSSDDDHKYLTELAILDSAQDFAKPKLFASSSQRGLIDRDYIIMEFVEGRSLGACWHLATNAQRERIIADLCNILKKINAIDPAVLPDPEVSAWPQILKSRAHKLADKLYAEDILTSSQLQATKNRFNTYLGALKTDTLYPVNWDIHFDNIIVNDGYAIQSMIDFENVQIAALDNPLFIIRDMMREPSKFLATENEKHANPVHYEKLQGWYQKYYPQMFEFDQLETRIAAYELINSLHLMQQWSHNMKLVNKFKKQIAPN